ncbi:MAG: hypothetical protein PVH62_09265 [Anaerolineae bacterium]|jgi:hypothetical protein
MQAKYVRRIIVGVILASLVALTVWAYSYTPALTARASEEWSRGYIVGKTSAGQPAALQPVDDGVVLVWPNLEGQLELAHIGTDGEILLKRTLPVESSDARHPQLEVGADGRLHLLWRKEEQPNHTIRYAVLESDGTPVSEPRVLSDPDREVLLDPGSLTLSADGRLHALWADETGIQWAVLSAEGTLLQRPTLLIPEGRAIHTRGQGELHLAWQRRTGVNTHAIYYASLDPESGEVSEPVEIYQVFLRVGQGLDGPTIGLDQEARYVFWVVEDSKYVSSQGQYAAFPLGFPQQAEVSNLPLRQGWNPTDVSPLEGEESPLLAALSEWVTGSGEEQEAQVALIALGQGETPGYEAEHIISASDRASVEPTLARDSDSHLHAIWLETEGFHRYRVVYASTAPEVKRNYNALTLWDVVDTVFSETVEFLTIVILTMGPMLFLWSVVPMTILLVYHLITVEERLETLGSQLVLGAALVVEVMLTLLFPPRASSEFPLAFAWLPLRWVAPVATAMLAAVGTFLTQRGKEESSLFKAFFVFTAINSLLQLTVYFLL